ncbi:MAG: 6-phosphogluconolactonase [Thermodesulfobacteriota bacterium]
MKTGRLKGFYVYDTAQELFRSAARVLLELCNEEISRKGFFTVVLSGGSTPSGLYELLASGEFRSRVPWKDVHLFWGDERCVDPGHPDSNYGMAERVLLSKVPVPEGNLHRMRGEAEPEAAARGYEEEIRGFFGRMGVEGPPSFDLLLLGLGTDGHTLSLFPGTPALAETERLVVALPVGGGFRLTMTLPLVNNARTAVFLVTGQRKAEILRRVMEEDGARMPAQSVRPSSGNRLWLVDRDAASGVLKRE